MMTLTCDLHIDQVKVAIGSYVCLNDFKYYLEEKKII